MGRLNGGRTDVATGVSVAPSIGVGSAVTPDVPAAPASTDSVSSEERFRRLASNATWNQPAEAAVAKAPALHPSAKFRRKS